MNRNIVLLLEERAALHPDRTAMIERGESLTYRQLLSRVHATARRLERRGISRGDAILVVAPPSLQLYILLIALFHRGAVAVFVDAWSSRRRLESVERALPLAGFVGVWRARLLRLLLPALRRIPRSFSITALTRSSRSDGGAISPAVVGDETSALVTWTTGTTGPPKGADRTHGFLRAQHGAIVRHFGVEEGERTMATLPIFPLTDLAVGATVLLPSIDWRNAGRFGAERVVQEMRRERVESVVASPAFLERLAHHLLERGATLDRLRRIDVGGAAVMPRTARLLIQAFPGATITVVYGATEVEPVSMIDAREMLERVERELHSNETSSGLPVGTPVDSLRCALIDERGEWRYEGEVPGEICVSGDHVLGSYVGSSEVNRVKFIEHEGRRWLRTGDAGRFDPDGGLRLLGRWSERLVRRDRTIFTLPVELLLSTLDEVAVGTVLDHDGGCVAVVELLSGRSVDRERVSVLLRSHAVPVDEVRVLESIPRDRRHHSRIDMTALRDQIG